MSDYSPIKERPSVPTGQIVMGAVLIVVGIGWLLSAMDIATIPWRALLATVLIIVGIALVGITPGNASPGALPATGIALVIILAVLSTVSSTFSVPLRGGYGDRDYRPAAIGAQAEYHLIAGEIDLELGEVDFAEGVTRVEVGVTFGKIVIQGIPDGVAVTVNASAAAGQVTVFDALWEGVNVDVTHVDDAFNQARRRLIIDARVVFGQIEVRR